MAWFRASRCSSFAETRESFPAADRLGTQYPLPGIPPAREF
jgi:hypothetical protein